MAKNKSLAGEFWEFFKTRKNICWFVPIIALLFLVGLFFIFGQSGAMSSFLYVLF